MRYMTKAEFVKQFKADEVYINEMRKPKGKRDLPLLRTYWNDTIDSMVKNNELRDRAYDWTHLETFK